MAKNKNRQLLPGAKEIYIYRSVVSLILVNSIPIFGVLFLNWSLEAILFLYWAESGVIGFFNLLKMIFVKTENIILKFFFIWFFIGHYSGFMTGHGLFLFFGLRILESFYKDMFITGELVRDITIAFLGLFVSHGYSFVTNYLSGQEREQATLTKLMFQPYFRIVIMHLTLLFGTFLVVVTGRLTLLVILLIVLKTIVDVLLHINERIKFRTQNPHL